MVHGGRPFLFVAFEDIASDPNLTCEVLYRTLLRELNERGGSLPPRLNIQLDNCIRENKNTVFIGFLCWLLERGLFKEIYLSFLPVGHTHFDCDQVASCIGWATKFKDITSIDELLLLLSQCTSPHPQAALIEGVADVAELFNPGSEPTFPVSASRIRFMRGCATKDTTPGREEIMDPLSPLHWRIRRDKANCVYIQTKRTALADQWSELFYPFETDAPRPGGRAFEPLQSGLKAEDLVYRPPRVLPSTRRAELAKALDSIRDRMTDSDMAKIDAVANRLISGDAPEDLHPDPCWKFPCDDEDDDEEDGPAAAPALHLREQQIYGNANLQQIARVNRQARGRSLNALTTSCFIAYETNYTKTTPLSDQNDFWVGKITLIDNDTREVQIVQYHTGTKDNLTKTAKYRVWTGKDKMDWVHVDRILAQFPSLSSAGQCVIAKYLKTIRNAIQLNIAEEEALD